MPYVSGTAPTARFPSVGAGLVPAKRDRMAQYVSFLAPLHFALVNRQDSNHGFLPTISSFVGRHHTRGFTFSLFSTTPMLASAFSNSRIPRVWGRFL
ncbi:hypothetical protein THIX_60754 [Thiomonas sp. X19]|nr:hypothetical protein THIX_60754 [Thiomonas sp. X19]